MLVLYSIIHVPVINGHIHIAEITILKGTKVGDAMANDLID